MEKDEAAPKELTNAAPVEADELFARAAELKALGYRLVTLTCVDLDEKCFEIFGLVDGSCVCCGDSFRAGSCHGAAPSGA